MCIRPCDLSRLRLFGFGISMFHRGSTVDDGVYGSILVVVLVAGTESLASFLEEGGEDSG